MHCYFIRWIVVKYLAQIIWHIGNRYFPLGHTTKSSVAVLLGRKYLYNWKQPNLLGRLCGPVSPKCLHLRPINSISSNPADAYLQLFLKNLCLKENENKQKEAWVGPFKKINSIFRLLILLTNIYPRWNDSLPHTRQHNFCRNVFIKKSAKK